MSLVCVGVDLTHASLEVLERFTIPEDRIAKLLSELRAPEAVREAVVLSTCNRFEVYAVVDGYHDGVDAIREIAFGGAGVLVRTSNGAAEHLLMVAAGLRSVVVGEQQILGQVRRAFATARAETATGPVLNALFRAAIRAGRRARAETSIASAAASLAEAAVVAVRGALGSLQDRTVLVVGAGRMATLAARAFAAEGARILIANRTAERAHALAAEVGGQVVGLPTGLRAADAVVTATAGHEPVLTRSILSNVRPTARGRLPVIDLAVPRDVAEDARALAGVAVTDVASLRAAIPEADPEAVADVALILGQELARFDAWYRAHGAAPVLAALTARAEALRRAEVARATVDERTRAVLDEASRRVIAKLIHDPLVAIRETAGTRDGDTLQRALRRLFAL